MKQITITLPDADASKFVNQLMDMNVTFTVQTTVARDPLVFAALETPKVDKDPARVEASLAAAKVGVPEYIKQGRKVQRLTPDGRTSLEVVEAKLKQFAGKKFHLREIQALSEYSGFQPQTLQAHLQAFVGQGRLVKLTKWTYQEVPAKGGTRVARSPLPNGSSSEAPLASPLASSTSESNGDIELARAEGWTS